MTADDSRAAAVDAALDRFEAAWSEGDRRAIYDAALAAWRACPAPELAELVERGAEKLGNAMSTSVSQSSWKARFVERARAAEPYEVAALLRSLHAEQLPRVKLAACLVELPSVANDPAVGRAALELVTQRPEHHGGSAWSALDRKLILWAESSRDARLVAPIAARAAQLEKASSRDAYAAKLRGWLARAEAALKTCVTSPLPASAVERVAALATRFEGAVPRAKRNPTKAAPSELEALERAVMENPGDDGALAVWSDALQRVEDPRGELIALQLAGALDEKGQRRAEKLVAAHWRTWLGPIASVIVPGSVVFERGVFAACTTRALRATQVSIFSHPRWATLRRITFGGAGVLSATMPHLEEVCALPAGSLARAERLAFPALRSLELTLQQSWPVRSLARLQGMPALRRLALRATSGALFTHPIAGAEGAMVGVPDAHSAEVYSSVFEAPIAAQLEHLELPLEWTHARWLLPELAQLVAKVRAAAPALRTFTLDAFGATTLALDLERRTAAITEGTRSGRTLERGRAVTEALGLRFVPPT